MNLLLFLIIYLYSNDYAENQQRIHLYFEWELGIPLISWMIVPYMLFNLMWVVPLVLLSKNEISKLGLAFGTCTLIGGVIFLLFPAELGFARSAPANYLAPLYDVLFSFDKPYNLVPSLHVSYVFLYYLSCRNKIQNKVAGVLFSAWILITISSVILTHQHHLIDIAAGILLASLSSKVWTTRRTDFMRLGL